MDWYVSEDRGQYRARLFQSPDGDSMDWYLVKRKYVKKAVKKLFQSPDGDSMDWYSTKRICHMIFANGFQSPDGDSMDWYDESEPAFVIVNEGFSPLTGIRWIGTAGDIGGEAWVLTGPVFQSPDGDSMDWYRRTARWLS